MMYPFAHGKKFRPTHPFLREFCKSCDPEAVIGHLKCEVTGGCPLQPYYQAIILKQGEGKPKRRSKGAEIAFPERTSKTPIGAFNPSEIGGKKPVEF